MYQLERIYRDDIVLEKRYKLSKLSGENNII